MRDREMLFIPEHLRKNLEFMSVFQSLVDEFNIDVTSLEKFTDIFDSEKVPRDFIRSLSKEYYAEKNIYMSFIPEYLRSNKDFQVFLQLLFIEFDISTDNINKFTDIINPDKVPKKFIEALGSYTDFRFIENADDDFNRELLMRMQTIYKQRGTDHSIIMAATHGSNLGYVGGDIFVPGYDISKDTATLIVANNSIFTHSKSKHSGSDMFADGEIFRPGVLIIQLPYLDKDIIERITEVMPAGVRFKFFLNTSFMGNSSDESLGKFGELSYYKYFRVEALTDEEKKKENSASNMEMCISPVINSENFAVAKFSTNVTGRRYRSGRMVTSDEVEMGFEIGASMLLYEILCKDFLKYENASGNIKYIESPSGEKLDVIDKRGSEHLHRDISEQLSMGIDLNREVRLTAVRSYNSSVRSGNGKMSGILTHVIDSQVQLMEITPYDSLYYTCDVDDLRPDDFRDPFYQSNMEFSI